MEDSPGRGRAPAEMTQKLETLDPQVLYTQENYKLMALQETYTL